MWLTVGSGHLFWKVEETVWCQMWLPTINGANLQGGGELLQCRFQ